MTTEPICVRTAKLLETIETYRDVRLKHAASMLHAMAKLAR